MIKVDFIPETDIDNYLYDEFNVEIYKQLSGSGSWKSVFEPLEFLNILYEQSLIVDANYSTPTKLINHLLELGLAKDQLYYLLFCLRHLITQKCKNRSFPFRNNYLNTIINLINSELDKLYKEIFEEPEPGKEQTKPEIKPIFNLPSIPVIFDILQDFFSPAHQVLLKFILETGDDASEQLIFLDNGNRLADAFKQLKDSDIITGCKKIELEDWIYRNFQFRNRKQITKFKPRYLSDIISTDKDKCQNPILNVSKDKIISKA